MKIKFFQKSIISIILIGLVWNPLFSLTMPKKAHAFLVEDVITEINTGITAGATIDTGVNTSGSLIKSIAEWALKIAGQILKRVILDRLVDALIAWIQRGGEGTIIDDWGQFWEDAGQSAVGVVALNTSLAPICDPYKLQLNILFGAPPKFTQQIGCTLDKIVKNFNDFTNNFENGRWIAYNELLAPQNNFYGATLIAWDTSIEEKKKGETASQNEAIAGGGFLSVRGADGKIITPGSYVGGAVKKALVDTPIDSIIGADDIAAYVSAIATAFISTYTKKGLDEMLGKRKQSSPPINTDPCANQTGDALRACLGFIDANKNVIKADSSITLSKIDGVLNLKKQTLGIVDQSINKVELLGSASTTASTTLSTLTTKKQTLQNEVEVITAARETVSNSTDTTLIATILNNPLLDQQKANDEFSEAQTVLTSLTATTTPQ